ncbi:MAG: hypothetical protein AAGE79_09740 [Acinetobacter pittii]
MFIKYHVDLKFIHDKRKWYEKIRFILPIFLLPIFFGIYYFWDHYPEQLIKKDTQIEKAANPNSEISSWPISTTIIYSPSQDIEEPKTKFQEIGEKYGTYGDTYGSLNTLFTGFAFAGLIISIFIQLLELRQTRKELANQSKAMADQKTEFSAQTKILEKQADINANQQKIIDAQFKETQRTNFLNHFLKLIDQKNLLLEKLTFPKDDSQIQGISVIIEYSNEFRKIRKNFDPEQHTSDFYHKAWDEFTKKNYGSYNYQVKSYFKIYRVIFYTIFSSKFLSDSEKKYYGYVFRMFLSLEEQLVLMWISTFDNNLNNCCNKLGLLSGIYNKEMTKTGVTFFKFTAFNSDEIWKPAFDEYNKDKKNNE